MGRGVDIRTGVGTRVDAGAGCRGKGRVLYVVEGKDALFYERCVGSPHLIAKVGLPSPFYIIG